ncbi:hypothetical protein STTU_5087 [Streptomyces sp. Tu6071]|nr:hypothetical protein STTU_5087 [Streptomyces sp. Tu6071]
MLPRLPFRRHKVPYRRGARRAHPCVRLRLVLGRSGGNRSLRRCLQVQISRLEDVPHHGAVHGVVAVALAHPVPHFARCGESRPEAGTGTGRGPHLPRRGDAAHGPSTAGSGCATPGLPRCRSTGVKAL